MVSVEDIGLGNLDEFVGGGRDGRCDGVFLHGKFKRGVAHDESLVILMFARCRSVDIDLVAPLLQGVSEAFDRDGNPVDDGLVDVGEVGDVKFLWVHKLRVAAGAYEQSVP